jgi:aromatic ring-cleaving dioxygenase
MSEPDYAYPMGCCVHYHPVIGGPHDGKIYQVIARRDLGHRLVYWLEGKSGCVTEEALTWAEREDEATR